MMNDMAGELNAGKSLSEWFDSFEKSIMEFIAVQCDWMWPT